ncbi:MAG: MFS transporter [Acidimicrobiales bacterium]
MRLPRPATPTPRRSLPVTFGWVSLLQDLGSKMVVPVLPLFLALELGASPLAVGLVEGLAGISAAVAAAVGGRIASRRPAHWVRVGYGLSSIAKPALALATTWPAVLAIRLGDRAGKGLRDGPRDLLLAAEGAGRRGRAFGVQQAMDKTGGFLGPLAGLALFRLTGSFRAVFVVAFVPCVASVLLLRNLVDPEPTMTSPRDDVALASDEPTSTATEAERTERRRHRQALVAVAAHSLGFAPVSLLLLRALDARASATGVLLAFAGLRLVTALASYPAGRAVDRLTPQLVSLIGMLVSAAAVATVALATTPGRAAIGLAGVGLADALTKGPTKAWLASLAPAGRAGAVLGDRAAVTGGAGLVAGIAIGAAWGEDGTTALLVAAAVAAVAAAIAAATPRVSA